MAALLPKDVAVRETTEDQPLSPSWAEEHPEEAVVVARAVASRRREFVTTRACARSALAELGLPAGSIPRGRWGSPVWPGGVCGSLTHCAGYRGAAVAWQRTYRSLGIDAEPREPLPEGVLDLVTDAHEQAQLRVLTDADPSTPWDRLWFSAKEAVYKAWFPVAGDWLDFSDVVVSLTPHGTFSALLRRPGNPYTAARLVMLAGRWAADRQHVATALVIP